MGPREMIVTKALCKWRMLGGALTCSRNGFHLAQNLGHDAPLAHTLDFGIYTFQATSYLLLDLHCPPKRYWAWVDQHGKACIPGNPFSLGHSGGWGLT